MIRLPGFDEYLAAQVEEHMADGPDDDEPANEQDDFDDEPDVCGQFWSPN